MATKTDISGANELTTEQKIEALYNLQLVDSEIDQINLIKGQLPLEVADLDDEVAKFNTRIETIQGEIEQINQSSKNSKEEIEKAKALIERYSEQQKEVRNNREYESLSKELEYQALEIELAEKHIKEFSAELRAKKKQIEEIKVLLEERKLDLEAKRTELANIEASTAEQLEELSAKSEAIANTIEERIFNAYKRIRSNVRNGLAVVTVQRDACGGCFNRIPPQRQLDIQMNKRVIVCEYCGRVLVPNMDL